MDQEPVEQSLARLRASLLPSFDIRDFRARNEIAHKWKATFRSLLIREAVHWRVTDLLQQSYDLHRMDHSLGALILLRSALETLATLIYLNQQTAAVLGGSVTFDDFQKMTERLSMGSKNNMNEREAVNILTVLRHCARRYDWIETFYADLSECAHPNYEGLLMGYSRVDRENHVENFSNHWPDMYAPTHETKMSCLIMMFEHEYNITWEENLVSLEAWLVVHDAELEATRGQRPN